MARRAARHFQKELDRLVDRFRAEYDVSRGDMVRALETTWEELIEEEAEVESEGDD